MQRHLFSSSPFRLLPFMLLLIISGSAAMGQTHMPCALKNPTTFAVFNSPSEGKLTGMIGKKESGDSQCGNLRMTFSGTLLSASQLAADNSAAHNAESLKWGWQPGSEADAYCADYSHFKVINSTAIDPMTGYADGHAGGLRYVPDTNEYTSSIRIGNYASHSDVSADMLYYEFTVQEWNSLLTIWYSLVLENSLHPSGNPEFLLQVEMEDPQNPGTYLPATDTFCFVQHAPNSAAELASSNFVNFSRTGIQVVQGCTNGCETCDYLPWNKVVINLYPKLYRKVRLKMVSADCLYQYDYGLAYVAGDWTSMKLQANGCAAGSTDTLGLIHAPKGLDSYQWYAYAQGSGYNETDTALAHYEMLTGETDSVLAVTNSGFVLPTGDTVIQRTFMCRVTSHLNPSYPIGACMTTTLNNRKPQLDLDSTLACDNSITLRNRSKVPFLPTDVNGDVDTLHTVWTFYESSQIAGTPALVDTGVVSQHVFENAGIHTVVVKTPTFDSTCWSEHVIHVRSLKAATPVIELSDQDICHGDSLIVYNRTMQANYSLWELTVNGHTDSIESPASVLPKRPYDTTTYLRLTTHDRNYFVQDTDMDGIMDHIYCFASKDTVIRVQQYPRITINGDITVCKGQLTNAVAHADMENCTFAWYEVLGGQNEVSGNATLAVELSRDKTYYVKAVNSNGCESWDSVTLMLVDPELKCSTDRICTGDAVKLWGSKAASYEWSANPDDDATFWGQENNDTIVVSPLHTTTYTMVGKGSNGCGATELRQKIVVYDYPTPAVQLTPGYIDSENPAVQFSDVSPNGTNSLWNFGDGTTGTSRSVVHNFNILDVDSILVTLTTCNPLNCCNDTQFYVPVGVFGVWYPNVFTPRMESNSTFHAYTKNVLLDYEIYIYDRNGSLVFHSVDPQEGWDGTYKGKPCPQGTYVYIATYKRDDGSTRTLSQKGTVTLLR